MATKMKITELKKQISGLDRKALECVSDPNIGVWGAVFGE